MPKIPLPNEVMSASKEDLEDELSSSSSKIQVNEPNKSHGRETINVHKVFYKGYVLDIRKVQEKIGKNIISIYHEKIGQRKRLLAKCLLCCEFEEAKKFSKNGLVYIAHGVRFDTEEKNLLSFIF